jgi:hypothetical protein
LLEKAGLVDHRHGVIVDQMLHDVVTDNIAQRIRVPTIAAQQPSMSLIAEAAITSFLSPDADERREAAIAAALGRRLNQGPKLRRNLPTMFRIRRAATNESHSCRVIGVSHTSRA